MAKPKTHYWKKGNPRNPVPLENGGYFEVEIVSQSEGIAQVTDPDIQEELVKRLGTYGLEQIDKETYEGLKKKQVIHLLKSAGARGNWGSQGGEQPRNAAEYNNSGCNCGR